MAVTRPFRSPARLVEPQENAPEDPFALDRDRIVRARAGDQEAFADLYRTHRDVALRAAARVCRPADVDDVVSEAFARVFDQISRGGGPQTSFRAYLLTSVRSAATDMARRGARLVWTDVVEDFDRDASLRASEDAGGTTRSDSQLLADALSSLPLRWQLVLWWTVVERRSLAEVGSELDLNPNAVAALGFRAREGLRDAYLDLHLTASAHAACAPWRPQLPPFARGRLAASRAARLEGHLAGCGPCRRLVAELRALLSAGVR